MTDENVCVNNILQNMKHCFHTLYEKVGEVLWRKADSKVMKRFVSSKGSKSDNLLIYYSKKCTLFSCIWIAFWPKSLGELTALPYPLPVGTSHQIFIDHLWKDNSSPEAIKVSHNISHFYFLKSSDWPSHESWVIVGGK